MAQTIIQVDAHKLRIENIIAEGGFGYVYKVKDIEANETYALKKINSSDEDSQNEIDNEIHILKSLQKHQHIMEFIAYAKLDLDNVNNVQGNPTTCKINKNTFTYYILTEFCDKGTLNDLELPIQELERSLRIIYQICLALSHMHKLGIIHRDIKAENVLFGRDGCVRLCDFGSSTKNCHNPTMGWTPRERTSVEEEMQRHTTPLYRPPEILETYLHYPINCAIDMWALGCLVYYVRFGKHAFPDSGKLAIVNCCYTIPKETSASDPLVLIIKQCIVPDPNERIKVDALLKYIESEFVDMDLGASIIPFTPSDKPAKGSPLPVSQISPSADTIVDNAPISHIDVDRSSKYDEPSNELAGLHIEPVATARKPETSVDKLLDMDKPNPSGVGPSDILKPKKAPVGSAAGKGAFDDLSDYFEQFLSTNGSARSNTNTSSNTLNHDK